MKLFKKDLNAYFFLQSGQILKIFLENIKKIVLGYKVLKKFVSSKPLYSNFPNRVENST